MESAAAEPSPSSKSSKHLQDQTLAPVREINPEIQKLNQLRQKVLENELKSHRSFWSTRRRQQLEEITLRVIVISIIAGGVLGFVTAFWFYHFAVIKNMFSVTVLDNNGSAKNETVKSSFISGIKDVESAIDAYIVGVLLLIEGGILAHVARHSSFKSRSWVYLGAIVAFAASIALIVIAPLSALFAENNSTEMEELKNDEYHAFKLKIKGSIKYFQSDQCNNTDTFIKGKEKLKIQGMKSFCKILFQLVGFLYFMWVTAVIPLVSFLACCMQVVVNRKYWAMKAVHRYKPIKPIPKQEQERKRTDGKERGESIV